MSSEIQLYHYVYKITNKVNNKFYVGVHKTVDLNDGYFGSGKLIKRAIAKYGIDNFEKTIIYYATTEEEAYELEALIVDEDFISRKDTYNLNVGGQGGWYAANQTTSLEMRKAWGKKSGKLAVLNKTGIHDPAFNDIKDEWRKLAIKAQKEKGVGIYDKKVQAKGVLGALSEESKIKRKNSLKNIKHQQGSRNSQYGKMWIYNIETHENTRINKEDEIPEGWAKGRKINSLV
jgi:hypothetical protein